MFYDRENIYVALVLVAYWGNKDIKVDVKLAKLSNRTIKKAAC